MTTVLMRELMSKVAVIFSREMKLMAVRQHNSLDFLETG